MDIRPGLRGVSTLVVSLLLVTSVLATVPLPAAAADPEGADSPGTAQSLTVATGSTVTVSGGFESGDEDWYAFEVDRGEAVAVNATRPANEDGGYQIRLRRQDPQDPDNGLSIGNGDTSRSVSPGELEDVGFVASVDGTYLVEVDGNSGSYEFDLRRFETDSYEPNDRVSQATSYTVGTTRTGELTDGDDDWFRFDAVRGQAVAVNATRPASQDGSYQIRLRRLDPQDPDNALAIGNGDTSRSVSPGELEDVGFIVPVDGTYLVEVSGNSGTFEFDVNAFETDGYEPNDRVANATPYTVGTTQTGELTDGDDDWFSFEADYGETVFVNATRSESANSSYQIRLRRQDPQDPDNGLTVGNGDTSRSVSPGETERLAFVAPVDGTYLVEVSGNDGTFEFESGARVTQSYEPNDDPGNATALYENPLGNLTGGFHPGDEEWFGYDLRTGELVNVTATRPAGADGSYQIRLRRQDPQDPDDAVTIDNGDTSRSVSPGETETVNFEAPADGTYYVLTDGNAGTFEADVRIDGEQFGFANDRFERPNPPIGNQDRANATDLGPGRYANLGMVDDDRDVFAVDLDAGERLRAAIDYNPTANDMALALANDAGTTLESEDTSAGGEELAFTAPTDGTYYLTVSGEADAAATYTLDLTVIRQVDVTIGPGADTVSPANTTTYLVNVTSVSAGLSTANLTLGSANASVVRIGSVAAAGTGTVDADVAVDGSAATVNVSELNPAASGVVTVARVTVETVENGSATLSGSATISTASGFEYPVRSVQGTTVTVAPPGDRQHESGVSQRLFDAVAGSDGTLERTDIIDMVQDYVLTRTIDGVAIVRADVLALVQYYVLN